MLKRMATPMMAVLVAVLGSASVFEGAEHPQTVLAERFFRGVYGCDVSVVRELASDDIFLSYPIFQEVLGSPVLRGIDAVEAFAERFCGKWADAEVTIHERLSDGREVVLVWSFSARDAAAAPDTPRSHWGGISLFKFDTHGKIEAEIGEESTPGPIGRLESALDK